MKDIIPKIAIILLIIYTNLFSQIIFGWISDTHIGSPGSEKDLLRIVNEINNQNVLFTIISGDIAEKGLDEELISAKKIFDKLNRPYFIIPGNHDTKWSESGCTKFSQIFGENRFYFIYDDYCFIGINSGIPLRGGGGHIAPEDLEWLKHRLNKLSPSTKVILTVHHPVNSEIDNNKELLELFKKFDRVLILVGHGHSNRPLNFQGIKGLMGRSSLSKSDSPGFNLVKLQNDSVWIETLNLESKKLWYQSSLFKVNPEKQLDEIQIDSHKPVVKKIFDTKTTLVKTGILFGKNLLFTDLYGFVYSISLSGRINWKKYFATSFFAKPVVYKNKIIFAGADGSIFILNQKNGKLIKKYNLSSYTIATPVIINDRLIVFTNDGCVQIINLKSDKIIKKKVAERNFETIPLTFNQNIIIGNWDNFLYNFSVNKDDSISVEWKWTENKNFYYSPAACSPVIDRFERVFISTPDKFISGIDFKTGKTIFRSNDFNAWESIGIDEEGKTLLIKSLVDTLYAISLSDSTPKLIWKSFLGYGLDTNPIPLTFVQNKILVPAKNGNLYIVDSRSGKLIDAIFLGNVRLNNIIKLNQKEVIVSNMDGEIFRIKIS